MAENDELRDEHDVSGSPRQGLTMATFAFFAGLTVIVFYGVAGPEFEEALGVSGALLGLLLSSPHISKVILRIPFGAWVDDIGGKNAAHPLWTHYRRDRRAGRHSLALLPRQLRLASLRAPVDLRDLGGSRKRELLGWYCSEFLLVSYGQTGLCDGGSSAGPETWDRG